MPARELHTWHILKQDRQSPDALTIGVENSVRDRRHHPDKSDLAEILAPEWVGMRIDPIGTMTGQHSGINANTAEWRSDVDSEVRTAVPEPGAS
jgi:hypothetical protein